MAELQKAVENCGSAGELLLARASMSEVALAVRDLVRSLEENFIRKHSEEDDEKAVDILVELAGLCEKFGLVHEPVDFMSNSSTDSCISAVEEAQDAIIRMLNSLDDRITGAVDNYGELQTEKLIAVSIDLFLVVGTAYCSQKTVQFLYEILASASNGKKSPKIGFIMMECILKFLKKSEAIAVKNFFLFNGRESQIAFNLPKISFHEGYTISFKIYLEKSESSEFSILSLKSESGLGLDLVLRRIPHKFDSHQLLLLINSTMQINFDSSEFFSEQWYFISLKQEYSHSGNRRFPVELYVNGHLKSSMNVMTYPNIRDTVLSGSMGSSFSQETQSIPSRIAEISFYSIALTSKEIQFLHNNYSLNRTAESGSEIRHNGISLHTINQTLTSFLHSIGMMDQHSEKDDIDFKIFSFSPSFIISNVCSDPRTTFLMQEPRVFYPHGVLNRFVKIRIFWKLDEQIQSFAEGISTFLPVCLKCDHFLLNDKSSFLINYIEILGSLIKSNKKIQSDFILKKEFKFLAYILSSIDGETLSYAFIESLERFVITCAWISAEQCIDSSKYPILTREIAKKRSLINDCIELILLNPLIWMRKDVDPKIRSNFLSILEDFVCSQAVNQFSYLKNNPQFSFDSLWLMLSNFLSYNDNNQVANSEETFQLRKRIIILYELTSEFRLSSEEIQSISFLAFNSKLVLETVEILSLLRKVLLNNRTGALNSLHRIGSPLIFISDSLWSRNEAIVLATLHFLGAEFQDSTAHSDKVEAVFSLIFQSLSSPASCGLTVLIYQAILEIVLNLSPGTIGISDPTEAVFQKLSAHPSSRELLREIPSTTVVRFLPVFGQMYQAIKILREKNGILFSKLIEFLVSDLRQILSNPNNIASSLLNIAFMQFLRDLIIDLYEKRGTSFDELYNRVFSESGVERSDINPFFSGFSSISSDDMSSRYMQLLDIISSMFTFALTYLENGWEFYLQFLCQLNNELDPCTSNATNTRLSLQADILFLIAIRLDLQKNRKICGKNLQILIIFLNPQFMFPSTGSTSYRRQSRDWISVWVEDPLTSSIISDNGRKCASLYSFMHLLVSNDIPLLLLDPPIISDNFLTLLKISRQDFRIFFNSEAPLRSLCGIIYTNLEMALEKLDSSLYERMLSHLFKALSIFSKEQDIAFRKSKNLHGVLSREVILILRKVMFIWEDRQSCTQLEMMSSKELDNFVGCFTAISQWVSSIEDKFCPFAPVKSSELQLDENRLSQLHHFLQKRQFKGIDRLLISSSVKKFLYPSSKQIQIPISLDLIQEKDFIIDPEFLQHVLMRYGWGFLEQKIKSQLQFVVSSYLKKVRDDEEGIVSKFSVLSSDLIQGISRTLSDSTRRIQSISESLYEKRLKYFQEQIFCERNHHLKFEKFRLEYAQRILESVLKLHDLINSSISPWRDSGIVSPHPLWKLNTFQDQQQRRPLLEQVFDLYDNSQEMIPSHSDYLKNEDNFDPVVSQIPIKTDDIVKEFLSTNDESSLHLKISANEDGEQDLIDDDLSGSGWEVLNMEFDQENMNGVRKSNGFFSVECSMILPFDCVKGSLHINHEEMVFTPNLEETLKYCPTNLVHVIDDVFSNNSDHQVGRFLNRNLELLRKRCRVSHSLSLKHLKYVYNRRYLLKRTALEVFNLDGKSFLYDFTTEDIQKEVIRFIRSLKPPNLDYLSMSRAEKLLRSSNMTERWQRREISNFEYLMYLNSVSGRSYNDINQYPIFPWIISDYTSSEIDLSNISTFRDLTKPIGALSDERFKKLEERFESLSESDIPPFFYGSHYSNAATVIYYLIRIEPFASLHVELQSGRFDFADRLFHSIPQLWETCLSSMSCFKELIPEFFYLPEFLENVNNFDLGVKQDGKRVTDVELPP